MSDWTIGIIGGAGLYAIDALEDPQWIAVQSPWGDPSDEILCGTIGHVRVRFLPRHGRGHRIAPSTLDSRANIDALKRAGCTDILAVSAVGSLSEELAPGRFVTVDQFIDNTKGRPSSFFGDGFVAHVSMADPVCDRLSGHAAKAVAAAGGECTEGATYLAMEGPQFSTQAESELFRTWGCKLVGMTNGSEAKLAREAGMEFCTIAMVTDFDCWHPDHQDVDVAQVVAVAKSNATSVSGLLEKSLPQLAQLGESRWAHVLDDAVMTAKEHRCPEMMQRTAALFRSS